MTDLCICGHDEARHRYQGGNQHGTFTYLDDCRADDCECPGFGVWVENVDADDETDDEPLGEIVTCTVCGADIGRGPGGLGLMQHSGMHRREFVEEFSRNPRGYDEVRRKLGRPAYHSGDAEQLSLAEAVDDRARQARNDEQQASLGDHLATDGGRSE